ncbi:hypothetical protein ACH5RR_001188 [Cinchona calisaya]|uniref:Uncharacterized protein n=1 Tax=Cinchona calisaya TaxID=153742 RepID=A0ABD3B3W0_9GENT
MIGDVEGIADDNIEIASSSYKFNTWSHLRFDFYPTLPCHNSGSSHGNDPIQVLVGSITRSTVKKLHQTMLDFVKEILVNKHYCLQMETKNSFKYKLRDLVTS